MLVDTSLNTVYAGVYNVVLANGVQNASWTNVSSSVQVTGNTIQKTSGTSAWDAGAISTQQIASGNGYMEFTAGDTITWRMCGLGNGDSSTYYDDIEYAFFLDGGAGLSIYEAGTSRGSFGTYAATDRLKVAVESGVVKYYRNGTLLYTSSVAPQSPLQVDTSLNTVYAGVYNVVVSTGPTPGPINYVLADAQGSTRAVMNNNGSSSVITARRDYLPFGEEIGSGIGLRTGTQGYGASDTNRQKYAMLERDDTTGLDHTWFRKYESLSGRWTSPDPYGGSMTVADPQSFNRYNYVQNDPVNFVDPTGLHFELQNCHLNLVTKENIEGGADWDDRGEICELVWVDDGPFREPEPRGGGSPRGGPSPQNPAQKRKLDPNNPECLALARKIINIREDLLHRADDILKNPQNLPETAPGPRRNSVQGHREILKDNLANYERRMQEYNDKCGGPPPPVPIVPPLVLPGPNSNTGPKMVPIPVPALPTFMTIPFIMMDPCLVFPPLCPRRGT